jgi:hypothetical protein
VYGHRLYINKFPFASFCKSEFVRLFVVFCFSFFGSKVRRSCVLCRTSCVCVSCVVCRVSCVCRGCRVSCLSCVVCPTSHTHDTSCVVCVSVDRYFSFFRPKTPLVAFRTTVLLLQVSFQCHKRFSVLPEEHVRGFPSIIALLYSILICHCSG